MIKAIITDIATLKSSLRALGKMPLIKEERHLFDIDIANLAKIIEEIVLFETIHYVKPSKTLCTFELVLGEAIKPIKLNKTLTDFCSKEAKERMYKSVTIAGLYNVLGLIPKSFWTSLLDDTVKYLVFQGLGVKGKYSDIMKMLFFHQGLEEQDLDLDQSLPGKDMKELGTIYKDLDSEQLDWGKFVYNLEEAGLPDMHFCSDTDEQEQSGDSWQASALDPGFAITTEMKELTIKLLWLYFKTHYYLLLSEAYNFSYSPHSLRSPLLEYAVLSKDTYNIKEQYEANNIRKEILDYLRTEADKPIDMIRSFYGTHFIKIKFPPVFIYVLSKAKSLDYLLEETYQVRDSKPAIHYRQVCDEIDEAINEGNIKFLLKVRKEIESLCKILNKEFGVEKPSHVDLKIGYGPLSFTKKIPIPKILRRKYFLKKSYLVFLRNIYYDLIKISRLGKLYDNFFWDVLRKQ